MKVLCVYDKMPNEYEKYISVFFEKLKTKIDVDTLVYEKNKNANHSIVTYGVKDYLQRLLFKLKLTKYKSLDLKAMSKYDIVHIQYSYIFRKIIPLLSLKNKPKIIFTLRGSDTYIKPWLSKNWIDFYKNYKNQIDGFIVMSNDQKNYLKKWGVEEDKITVIPLSFGNYSDAKPKYPNQNILKIVSAFRMTWEKNIQGSILVAKQLKEQNIPFQYDIYGNGHDLGELYFLIDKFNLQDFVTIKGNVSNEILRQNLTEYDFLLQLSVSESLSATVIEAQSIGIPAIISNSGGIKETIIPYQTGICNDYFNIDYFVKETIELWNDREKYYRFSENAINFANDNYTLKLELERTIDCYNKVLNYTMKTN